MAGAGYKLFNTGDVLTAAQVNTYLQEQTVMVFASSTARTTALSGVLAEGMMSYLQDTNAVEVYNGSAWVGVSGAGDVTEVQAGTGISVASGTGPIPVVTNTMATAFDAKGDLVAGTGADTFAKLTVGANDTILTADSSTATGLKWAAAAGGGGMTSLASGNLSTSSSTLTLSSISGAYNDLRLVIRDIRPTNNDKSLGIQVNSVTDNDFFYYNSSGTGAVYGNATVNAIAGGMANSNDENYLIVDFLDYANTASGKCIESVLKYNEAGGQAGKIAKVSGAANTTSAITSISIIMSGSDNFGLAGSYVLYGVK